MQRGHVWPVVVSAALCWMADDPAEAGARRESVALTVYNQNFALVKDVRVLDMARGSAEVRVDNVAASIDPTSVHFAALDHPEAVAVLEQNYKYDLADADRLFGRYLDHPVAVTLAEKGGEKAGTLLSYSGGDLVLKTEKGASIVNRGQVSNVSLGEVPGGLIAKPALVWMLASDRNHKDTAVQVQVVEHLFGDWTITEHSHEFVNKDAQTVEFPVTLPANGSVTVLYTVRTKY